MKIIENTPLAQGSQPAGRLDEIISSLRLSRRSSQDLEAQESVIASMKRILDNRFFLVQDVELTEFDSTIPLVLVGPGGVFVLNPSGARGVYRAKGDMWEKLDHRQKSYKVSSPNLLTRTDQMAQAVATFLASYSAHPMKVESALIFTDPGIHVETSRPNIRLVLVDAVDRFLSGLMQSPSLLGQEDINQLVGYLSGGGGNEQVSSEMTRKDVFSFKDEVARQAKPESIPESVKQVEKAVERINKIPFSSKQVIMLGGLVLMNIIILIGLVVYILINS